MVLSSDSDFRSLMSNIITNRGKQYKYSANSLTFSDTHTHTHMQTNFSDNTATVSKAVGVPDTNEP